MEATPVSLPLPGPATDGGPRAGGAPGADARRRGGGGGGGRRTAPPARRRRRGAALLLPERAVPGADRRPSSGVPRGHQGLLRLAATPRGILPARRRARRCCVEDHGRLLGEVLARC